MARILVIDDKPEIRDNCREALEEAGHTVSGGQPLHPIYVPNSMGAVLDTARAGGAG